MAKLIPILSLVACFSLACGGESLEPAECVVTEKAWPELCCTDLGLQAELGAEQCFFSEAEHTEWEERVDAAFDAGVCRTRHRCD